MGQSSNKFYNNLKMVNFMLPINYYIAIALNKVNSEYMVLSFLVSKECLLRKYDNHR